MPRGSSRLRRDRHACLGDQLFRCLVQAHDGVFWIMGPMIHFQNIFHGGNERGTGVGWDDPLFFQMRLEDIFFSVRPIVLSLARSTMRSSTTLSSSSTSVHRARPFGGGEQAKVISFASAAPSKMRRRAEFGECLRFSTASKPSSTSRCRVRKTVDRLVSRAAAIRPSLQPSPASEMSALSRIRALRERPGACPCGSGIQASHALPDLTGRRTF
jgi:hypothetical protein